MHDVTKIQSKNNLKAYLTCFFVNIIQQAIAGKLCRLIGQRTFSLCTRLNQIDSNPASILLKLCGKLHEEHIVKEIVHCCTTDIN